jgi:hypothetical protein
MHFLLDAWAVVGRSSAREVEMEETNRDWLSVALLVLSTFSVVLLVISG